MTAAAQRPAARREVESVLELTAVQQGMLFETLAAPESGLHVEQLVWWLRGDLDGNRLERAWRHLVAAHPVLRTGIVWKRLGAPLQVVLREVESSIERLDWSALEEEERRRRLDEWLRTERHREVSLAHPPLVRLTLAAAGPRRWVLVWAQHHLLLDGWALHRLFGQLLSGYRALGEGREPEIDPGPAPGRFTAWAAAQDAAAAESFWRAVRREEPTRLGEEVPPAVPRGLPRHDRLAGACPPAVVAGLRQTARRHRVTLNVLVQGGWALAASRFAAAPEVVFGVTVSTRPAELPELEDAVGVYIATVPLRVEVPEDGTVAEWLGRLARHNLELQRHAWVAPDRVAEWTGGGTGAPLYDSVLVFENYPVGDADPRALGLSLEVEEARFDGARTRHPVVVLATGGGGLGFEMVFDRRRVPRREAERMLEALLAALAALAGDPAATPGRLAEGLPLERRPRVHPEARRPAAAPRPPADPLEALVLEIWRQVLARPDLGPDDDFFAEGGHSLRAAQLASRLSRAFDLEVPLAALFEEPTAAGVARRLRRLQAAEGVTVREPEPLPRLVPDPRHRFEPFPLTDIQQAYWVGRAGDFELGNVATHAYLEIDAADLDVDRLEAAWRRLVERHDMLRAVVLADGRQHVLEAVPPYTVKRLDLRHAGEAEVAYELASIHEAMSHQVRPVDRWPLFEIRASLLPGGRVRLHVGYDLLIADARSFEILSAELGRLYADPTAELAPLPITFRDYVLAERTLAGGIAEERSLTYWRERLKTLPAAPELPLAVRPQELEHPRFGRRTDALAASDWEPLRRRATEHGLTPSMLLLATYCDVLAVWSKDPRFTVNLTLFNRLPLHPDVGRLVGDFTTLTLVATDGEAGSFVERARRLQATAWEGMEHRHVSGVRVLRELARMRGDRRAAQMPVVFTSTLALDADGEPVVPLGDVVAGVGQTPQVWLDCQVTEQSGELRFWWDAVEDLFPAGLLDDAFTAFGSLLRRLAREPEAWHREERGLVPEAQLEQRRRINDTRRPVPPGWLHSGFEAWARREPERTAVLTPGRDLTYGELDRRSAALAAALVRRGAGRGRQVAVVLEKSWEQVVAVLAVLRSGSAYLPVDPHLPPERLRYVVEHGGATLALLPEGGLDRVELPAGVGRVPVSTAEPPAEKAPRVEVREDDLAYVIYTSGSTGRPKGVMIDHRGAWNTVTDVNRRFGVGAEDRVLALSSLSFDLSVYDLFGTLAAGGALVLPAAEDRREPSRWLERMAAGGVTVWNSVPALMEMLIDHLDGGAEGGESVGALRLVLLSGDWIPVRLPDRIRRHVPGVRVVALGGATEASIWSNYFPVAEVDPAWRSIPYGRPLANQWFQVYDARLEPRPVWVPGELYIGGLGLARGYHADPEKTTAAFLSHPVTGERVYRTGDLGRYLPSGDLEFLGREDLQVKVRGHRVELGEIEALLEEHPAVEAAVATVTEAPGGGRHLVAYAVPRRGAAAELFAPVDGRVGEDPWKAAVAAARATPPADAGPSPAEAAELRRRLAGLTAGYAARALARLGAFRQAGERRGADELLFTFGIELRYRRWLGRILTLLTDEGLLSAGGGTFTAPAPLPDSTPDDVLVDLAARLERSFPEPEARRTAARWLDVYRRVGEALPQVLRGELDTLELVFESGRSQLAEQIYASSFRRPYRAARLAVEAWVRSTGGARVLEVGAGVGSLTAELLPVLPASSRYVYTDVSTYFLRVGRERFGDFPSVEYRLLDMERDPLEQGLAGAFDLVVAADVLHGATDLRSTVAHLRSLLAPGGGLLLVEHTRFDPQFNLDMGLAQGFDRAEDEALRPVHPLLTVAAWEALLAEQGFPSCAVLDPADPDELISVHALLAGTATSAGRFREELLREHLAGRLPEYMVPAVISPLDRLPLSANGKVDRGRLPGVAAPARRGGVAGTPEEPVEALLVRLWGEVLEVDGVGPRDDFFELGGDSLLATQLVSAVRSALGVELPLRALFDHPTPAGLADRVTGLRRSRRGLASAPPILPLGLQGDQPLSFGQQRLWFMEALVPGQPWLNIPGALRLEGELDGGSLALALAELARRHHALRTRYHAVDGEPLQRVEPPAPAPLPWADLSALPALRRRGEARRLVEEAGARPFDLSSDPPFRVLLLRLDERDHVLFFCLHHIAADAWSLGILVRETASLYRAFAEGVAPTLPEPVLQYTDYAAWQRRWLRGDALEALLAYWRRQLADLPPFVLETDRPRPGRPSFRGDRRSARLEPAVLDALDALALRLGATRFMVLLAAFKALLHASTGQRDLVVGSSIANRNRAETEEIIGFFVNILVLRTRVEDGLSFTALVERVREVTLDAYLHQDLPFERLVEELRPERGAAPGGAPLFQTLFVLESAPIPPLELPGLTLSPFEVPRHSVRYDLNFHAVPREGGLDLVLEFDRSLFLPQRAEAIVSRFLSWVRGALERPELPLADLAAAVERDERERERRELNERKEKNRWLLRNVGREVGR